MICYILENSVTLIEKTFKELQKRNLYKKKKKEEGLF